ncbi:MAG: PIN domain-containing protein [Algiphilus sp.]|uniref:PIN domain-containing protein n=1 Tax=Algiphilus sp. TaxID=1872431 RepID=UPI0032F06C69
MIFDTDVLIWFLRGNAKAAKAVDAADTRSISIVTYMELLQGARDKCESHQIKAFLKDFRFRTVPLTENIGHRASIYVEEYTLATSIGLADALVAATAVAANDILLTGNVKHYKAVQDLQLKRFNP